MQKQRKKFLFNLTCVFGIGLICLPFLSSCGNFIVIDSKGSSSVQPLLSNLGNEYSKNNGVEISVQAGGSSVGISSIANLQTLMGNASKSPRSSVENDSELTNKWKVNNLKTITLAIDAIGILLLPPKNVDNNWDINQNNIADLYNAFAGYNSIPLNRFYSGNSSISNEILITPYARSGGSLSSGTAEAFFKDSKLIDTTTLSAQTQNALNGGSYGPITRITNESNSEAYTNFKTNAKTAGSMIYLSLGFIQNNINTILNDGFVVMKCNGVEANIDNVSAKKYNWTRPFNTIISLNNTNKLINVQKFVSWILFSKYLFPSEFEIVQKIFLDQGLIFLNDDQLKVMFLTDVVTKDLTLEQLVLTKMDLFWKNDFQFNPVRFGVE